LIFFGESTLNFAGVDFNFGAQPSIHACAPEENASRNINIPTFLIYLYSILSIFNGVIIPYLNYLSLDYYLHMMKGKVNARAREAESCIYFAYQLIICTMSCGSNTR
jgi:hypothetical protein